MLEPMYIVYTVLALIPNILLMLLVLARMNRTMRLLIFKVEAIEREMKMVDESVKQVEADLRRTSRQTPPVAIQPPS
ncbi:MAG: hypothetical protein V2A73_18790 [Pseudomonadota bacterium]